MQILITGVAGLIGSNFAEYVIKNHPNVKIIGIDDLSGGYIENVSSSIDFHRLNLQEYDSVEKIFQKNKIDYIFHFAAYAAEGLSPFIRKFNYNNNLLVTTNLINMAIKYKIKRFIFTSSMAVYGHQQVPFDEKNIPQPYDPYGIAKYACELDLKIAQQQHGLEYVIIRPHNVYGKKQNIWDKYRNVLGIWINQYLNNQPLTIFGDGEQTRAFTHIDDLVEPLWNCIILDSAKNQIINLGGIHSISLNKAKDILLEIIENKDYKVEYLTERHEVKHAYSTYQKSVYILNFKHKTTLKDGLKEMFDWAKTQPKREIKKWEKYEIEDKIYDYWK